MFNDVTALTPSELKFAIAQLIVKYSVSSISRLAVTGEQDELLGISTQTRLLQALNPLELKSAEAIAILQVFAGGAAAELQCQVAN
ncbi:MAG: hypothetical protein ACYT04_63130, partial [Nostoc sp.]